MLPRHPVYIISKGRADQCLTAAALRHEGLPFALVVEPQEYALYAASCGDAGLLALPFSNLGQGSIPARNWVWEHAQAAGHARHWILDDNIASMKRRFYGQRILCPVGPALVAMEDFVERYANIALAGPAYVMFGGPGMVKDTPHPFYLNVHVYSCLLIRNALPYRWRGRYNEDTDLCLQVLAGGWCTVLFNLWLIKKKTTMTMRGGNTEALYQGDGRLKMARALERLWPGVVQTRRRFGRPQHRINWSRFDTPLKLKPGVVVPTEPNEYGMRLTQVKPIKSPTLRALVADSLAQQP